MPNLGRWSIEVSADSMPQKVATAIGELREKFVGAEYDPIAYLGSQVVNGVNHAVLAEQTLTTGRDTKNVVLLIFNEKGMDCTLVNIERVVEGGGAFGGTSINVQAELPKEAREIFNDMFQTGWVGTNIEPIFFIGTQMTKGVDYKYICKVTPVTPDPEPYISLVTINAMDKTCRFNTIIG